MQVELATNHFEYLPSLTQMIETHRLDVTISAKDTICISSVFFTQDEIKFPNRFAKRTGGYLEFTGRHDRQLAKYYVPFRYGFIELCLIRVLMNVVAIAGT